MKYFKICEPKTSWLLVDTHHHTCAKFAVFSPTLIKPEVKIYIFQNITFTTHITKGLRLQKMKTGVKKKKIPKCPAGCQSLPQKSGFSIPLQLRKIKSHPPFWSAPPTVNYTRKTIHHHHHHHHHQVD